ncbi:MAG: hypothetical protein H6747_00035 [Deltaproteobacteria bacterium]|nr:hypothetical protein [Deltaproteobacteria bacterium]
MPFDLERAASQLRDRHPDLAAFRPTLLDLLFATGCMVGETAAALAGGDAVVVRAAGPAAPSLQPPLVVVVVDTDPPHLASVRSALGPAMWPAPLAALGGPPLAIAWAAAIRVLASSTSRRPWRALYFRGPADGLGDYVQAELGHLEDDATIVQLVPSATPGQDVHAGAASLAWVDLCRPRNVWRFPACDQSYALTGQVHWESALGPLRAMLDGLDARLDWTLHDVHLYYGASVQLSAVLRTSEPIEAATAGFSLREVEAGQRLMFPINDALAALPSLAGRLGGAWGEGLGRPLHLHALPDGLRVAFLADGEPPEVLPERLGSLTIEWRSAPLVEPARAPAEAIAVDASETLGAIAAGVVAGGGAVWQVPALGQSAELAGFARGLDAVLNRHLGS